MKSAGRRGAGRKILALLTNLLFCVPSPAPWSRVLVTEALVLVGAAGGFAFLVSVIGSPVTIAMALATTLAHVGATQRREGRAWWILRWAARVPYTLVALFMVYQAVSFGYLLAWSVPLWVKALTAVVALAAVATSVDSSERPRVPVILALGVWIVACLIGWNREMHTLRCEDHLRAVAQPGVVVLAPSAARQVQCRSDERISIRYHPRKIWPSPLGEGRYLLATDGHGSGNMEAFRGALCELRTDPEPSVTCGLDDSGYTYGVAFGPDPSEIFVAGASGLLRVRAEPPFEVLAQVQPPDHIPVNLLHDPRTDQLTVFFDEIDIAERRRATDLSSVAVRPLTLAPEEIRFDPERREGLYCFASTPLFPIDGEGYLARAFGDDPLETRALGSSDEVRWTSLAFSDGCDLDFERRRAYVGVGTLGLVSVIDYDSGAVLASHWAGFGVRPVLLAPDRGRLYLGNYLSGEVREVELEGFRVTRRWFAGRFIRHLHVDADELFVTSTLGVVRIDLSVPEAP